MHLFNGIMQLIQLAHAVNSNRLGIGSLGCTAMPILIRAYVGLSVSMYACMSVCPCMCVCVPSLGNCKVCFRRRGAARPALSSFPQFSLLKIWVVVVDGWIGLEWDGDGDGEGEGRGGVGEFWIFWFRWSICLASIRKSTMCKLCAFWMCTGMLNYVSITCLFMFSMKGHIMCKFCACCMLSERLGYEQIMDIFNLNVLQSNVKTCCV